MQMDMTRYSGPINALLSAVMGLALIYGQNELSALISLLLVFPFITLWVSEGALWALAGWGVTGLMTYTIYGWTGTASALTVIVPASTVIGMTIVRRRPVFEQVIFGALAIALAYTALIMLVNAIFGIDLIARIRQTLMADLDRLVPEINRLATDQGMSIAQLEYELRAALSRSFEAMPAILFGVGLMMSWVNTAIAHALIRRSSVGLDVLSMATFKIPRTVANVGLVLLAASMLAETLGIGSARNIAMNLSTIGFLVLIINGLSAFSMMPIGCSRGPLLLLLVIVFGTNAYLWYAFAAIGVIDCFVSVRRSDTMRGNHDAQ